MIIKTIGGFKTRARKFNYHVGMKLPDAREITSIEHALITRTVTRESEKYRVGDKFLKITYRNSRLMMVELNDGTLLTSEELRKLINDTRSKTN